MGFGTLRLTGSAPFHHGAPSARDRSLKVLRRAVDLGVNHIDTAAFYFSQFRSANELINSALSPYPDDLVIATKIGPARDVTGKWTTPARPGQLRGQVEENLRQLGRDHLDLVYLRVMGQDSIAEHFDALAELRDTGLVRHLGVSGVQRHHLAEAQAIAPVVSVQNRFGIEWRSDEELMRHCGTEGIAFVPYFSIAGDRRVAGAPTPEKPTVLAVAHEHAASPAQVRLAWTLQQGDHVLPIPGTGDPEHLAENLAAGTLRLTDEELARISASSTA
jgi:aryl-alcohol dehydrogenase-like predicted oxidoreductase